MLKFFVCVTFTLRSLVVKCRQVKEVIVVFIQT